MNTKMEVFVYKVSIFLVCFLYKKIRFRKNKFSMYKGGFIMDEDETKYGEFISSYFAWMTLEEQKEIVKKLEEITKKQKQ